MSAHARKKVFLGLSGGVDSAVAASLLLGQGYDVVPVFMKCWSPESAGFAFSGECPWEEDQRDAIAVCEKLGISDKFRSWNFEQEYFESVLTPYLEDTKRGLTPNPDVTCNETIKFGAFFERALAEGADFVATGHYARIRKHEPGIMNYGNDERQLLTAQSEPKNDQTYFLYRMTQVQLAHTLFPIGELGVKAEVREMARELGFSVADKRSTRGLCFVGKGHHRDLLTAALPETRGPIVTTRGAVIGEHEGVARYTLGQSKGIGVKIHGGPYYVVEKDLAANTLVVAPAAESWRLWHKELVAGAAHWVSGRWPKFPFRGHAAIRHPQTGLAVSCVVEWVDDEAFRVVFDEEEWAPCPGQSVVLYDEKKKRVLGGGVIR